MDLYRKKIAGLIGLVISLALWVKAHKSHRNDCKALLACIRKSFSFFSQSVLQSFCSSFPQLNGRFPALVYTTPGFIVYKCRPALSYCKSKRAGTDIYALKSGVSSSFHSYVCFNNSSCFISNCSAGKYQVVSKPFNTCGL